MKVYVRLAGGLGNQLFQMAALSLLSRRFNLQPFVNVDALSGYAQARQPEVFKLLSQDWVKSVDKSSLSNLAVNGLRLGRWLPLLGVGDQNFWRTLERGVVYPFFLLDGYFQTGWNYEHFCEARDIMMPFAGSRYRVRERISSDECAIHIRGGDFLKVPHHQVIDHGFYVEAVRSARAVGWRKFLVVTDDRNHAATMMNLVSSHIAGFEWRMADESDDAMSDFELLRIASARIIGNSTFSWWATALDDNRGQTWAPVKFTRDRDRDFFLPWEVSVP